MSGSRGTTRLSNRGFTLLELLLALALTVSIAALLGASLYTAFKAKTSIDDALEATRDTDVAADLLAHELALALPPTPSNANTDFLLQLPGANAETSNGTIIGPFQGDQASVTFYASGAETNTTSADVNAPPQADVREITYLVIPDPNASGKQMLIRRVYTNLLDPVAPDVTTTNLLPADEVLAKNVLKFTLAYFDGTNWVDTWDSAAPADLQMLGATTPTSNVLPQAVQFTLELTPLKGQTHSRLDTRTVPLPCAPVSSSSSTTTGGF